LDGQLACLLEMLASRHGHVHHDHDRHALHLGRREVDLGHGYQQQLSEACSLTISKA
jgi:hypothetical protein